MNEGKIRQQLGFDASQALDELTRLNAAFTTFGNQLTTTVNRLNYFNDNAGKTVAALKQMDVPTNLYTVSSVTYGTVTAVQVVVNTPLSTITDQGWSDDLYVTFESSVGPDIVDILKYIIENYTDLTSDDASFDHVQEKLEPFPANFPILDRKNTLEVLRDIAFPLSELNRNRMKNWYR